MVIVKIFLNFKLDVDVLKFCIYNKIYLILFSNICVNLSLLLILKRIDGRSCTNFKFPNLFPPLLNSDFFNIPFIFMLNFMYLLFF